MSYKNIYLVNGNKYLKRSLNNIAVRDVQILNLLMNKYVFLILQINY